MHGAAGAPAAANREPHAAPRSWQPGPERFSAGVWRRTDRRGVARRTLGRRAAEFGARLRHHVDRYRARPWTVRTAHRPPSGASPIRVRACDQSSLRYCGACRLDAWEHCGRHRCGAFALRFSAYAPGICSAIAGTASLAHLRHNVAIVDVGALPANAIEQVGRRLRGVGTRWAGEI